MKPLITFLDNNNRKLTITKVANNYLIAVGNKGQMIQIPEHILAFMFTKLEPELQHARHAKTAKIS